MSPFFQSFEAATGLPEWLAYLIIFVLGASIGSFLNVVIYRVPNEKSIVFPNSACPNCGAKIKAYDNIPILSWISLRGKCRGCSGGISFRYPAVELLTALLFILVYFRFGFGPFMPIALIFTAVLVALMFIDAEHMILPNVITYPFFVFAFVVRLVLPIFFGAMVFSDMSFAPATSMAGYPAWLVSLVGALLGAIAGGGSLWLVGELWKLARGVDAMGLGDVKMMLGVGALLGWRLTLLSIFLAAFSGAVIGIFVIAKQKDKDLQTQIPFGIFLGIGSFLSMLFGETLIGWYVGRFF